MRSPTRSRPRSRSKWSAAARSGRSAGRCRLPRTARSVASLPGSVTTQPSELVLTAGAGDAARPRSNAALAEARADAGLRAAGLARPARRPVDEADPTLGGVLACNLSGPRRIKAGAARDHFLGFRAVSGRGEIFKAGGKVVKNVTGYDLCKLMAGSYGTLAALEEVTVKVLPRPEAAATVLLCGLDAGGGGRELMAAALGSPHEVSGAAYLPAGRRRRLDVAGWLPASPRCASRGRRRRLRFAASALLAELARLAEPAGSGRRSSTALLAGDRRCRRRCRRPEDRAVWRVSVAPSRGAELARGDRAALDAGWYLDWGGGLVWLAVAGAEAAARGDPRCDPRRGRAWRRPRDAGQGLARAAPRGPGVRAAAGAARGAVAPGQGERSIRAASSIPAAWSKGLSRCRPISPPSSSPIPIPRQSEKILRACVHCGFCTATCPTYVLLGDELDSPRGRIYLIKDMLEQDGPVAGRDGQAHRPLPVLPGLHDDLPVRASTTCTWSTMRRRISRRHYRRPWAERVLRALLGAVLTAARAGSRWRLRWRALAKPFAALAARAAAAAARTCAGSVPAAVRRCDRPQVFPAEGERRMRVALLPGCAQQVLAPEINEATIRLLTRHGCEVVVAPGSGCCGALPHHLGEEAPALDLARANIDAWERERGGRARRRRHQRLGLRHDGQGLRLYAARGSGLCREGGAHRRAGPRRHRGRRPSSGLSAPPRAATAAARGCGSPTIPPARCSTARGSTREPKALLAAAGFESLDVPEGHLCCGSAGTYNMLQPEWRRRCATASWPISR